MTLPLHYDTRHGIKNWRPLGNFTYNDCTVAAFEHLQMVHNLATASTWKKLAYQLGYVPPTNAMSTEEYFQLLSVYGLPKGSGIQPWQLLQWKQNRGEIRTYAQISMVGDWDTTIREAMVAWDGCLVTLELTRRAYWIGTNPGSWQYVVGDVPEPSLDHAVAAVSYSTNIGIVTWGMVKVMTTEFANATVNGVWVFK